MEAASLDERGCQRGGRKWRNSKIWRVVADLNLSSGDVFFPDYKEIAMQRDAEGKQRAA